MIQQSYRYLLAPTPEQEQILRSHAGASRFAFNWGLALVKERLDARAAGAKVRVPWTYHAFCSEWAKVKDEVAPWRDQVVVGSFQAGFEQLGAALRQFSTGRNQGKRVGFPRFKAKGRARDRVIFQYLEPVDRRYVRIPKLGLVRSRESLRKLRRLLERDAFARVLRATLYEVRAGCWAMSFTVERSPKQRRPRKPRSVVGVDLGLRRLATLSTGTAVANPRPLQAALRRLARAQRQLDRQRRANNRSNYLPDGQIRPGPKQWRVSARMRRTQERIARLHARVRNLRASHAHLLTRRLTDEYGVIGVESLNVSGMLRDRHLARSISDVGWGLVLSQLQYKSAWAGALLVPADPFYPSSKTCNACGSVRAKLDRSATVFSCEDCSLVLDRDENAARNLARLGLNEAVKQGIDHPYLARVGRERLNARGGRIRPASCGWRCPSKREGSAVGAESSQTRKELADALA